VRGRDHAGLRSVRVVLGTVQGKVLLPANGAEKLCARTSPAEIGLWSHDWDALSPRYFARARGVPFYIV